MFSFLLDSSIIELTFTRANAVCFIPVPVQELAAALQNDIPAMVSGLQNLGLKVSVNMEDLTKKGVLS